MSWEEAAVLALAVAVGLLTEAGLWWLLMELTCGRRGRAWRRERRRKR